MTLDYFSQQTKLTLEKAARIKMLIMDVDGVLTDGRLFMLSNGEEVKAFHTLDGLGLNLLHRSNIATAIITGRSTKAVEIRAQQLGIQHYFHGIHDKRRAFFELLERVNVAADECAYVGDDVVDLPVMKLCGLPAAVPSAHFAVLPHALYVTKAKAGAGAVRELCDFILHAQGLLLPLLATYTADCDA